LYLVSVCLFSCTPFFASISQVIDCEDLLWNDLYCVGWGIKLYSLTHSLTHTHCCDNLWKSKFMFLEKPGKLWEFFSATLWPLCFIFLHPAKEWDAILAGTLVWSQVILCYTGDPVPHAMERGDLVGTPTLQWCRLLLKVLWPLSLLQCSISCTDCLTSCGWLINGNYSRQVWNPAFAEKNVVSLQDYWGVFCSRTTLWVKKKFHPNMSIFVSLTFKIQIIRTRRNTHSVMLRYRTCRSLTVC